MTVDFTGTWENQNESKLELHVTSNIVSGRFESGVGDNGQILWEEVSGRVLGDLITFNVTYERFSTVIAWVGQHTVENGIGKIKTHWLHATDTPDDQEQAWMWYMNRIGSDEFKRV